MTPSGTCVRPASVCIYILSTYIQERGRYTNTPRENRLCQSCKEIEDEIHFLDKCVLYNNIRNDFIKEMQENNQIITKPSDFMTSSNNIHAIAQFIDECFKTRSRKIEKL